MPTLSAHTDEATSAKVNELARLEDRTTSQIAAAALRWYVRLQPAARDALRRIEAQGDLAIEEAMRAAGRALIDQRFNAAVESWAARTGPQLHEGASEEDILNEAVRLTRRR